MANQKNTQMQETRGVAAVLFSQNFNKISNAVDRKGMNRARADRMLHILADIPDTFFFK